MARQAALKAMRMVSTVALQEGACEFAPVEQSVTVPEKTPVESTGPVLVNQLG